MTECRQLLLQKVEHEHTSQPASPEGSCLVPSPLPSKRCQMLPENHERNRYPLAKRAASREHGKGRDQDIKPNWQHTQTLSCHSSLVPPAGCLPPAWPGADVRVSPWSGRRSLRRTCWWSQTWPHPADRSGWWHSPVMEAGSLCQSQRPRGRTRVALPGWRCQGLADARFLCSPGLSMERHETEQRAFADEYNN